MALWRPLDPSSSLAVVDGIYHLVEDQLSSCKTELQLLALFLSAFFRCPILPILMYLSFNMIYFQCGFNKNNRLELNMITSIDNMIMSKLITQMLSWYALA